MTEKNTHGVTANASENTVQKSIKALPSEKNVYRLSELYKVFGDYTRIRILYVLLESEVCVGDLANMLSMNQSAVSHQLKILKQSNLISARRDGKSVFYSLADDHVGIILSKGIEHIEE